MGSEGPQFMQLDCFDDECTVHFSMRSEGGAHGGGPLGVLPVRAVRVRRDGNTVAIEIELTGAQLPKPVKSC